MDYRKTYEALDHDASGAIIDGRQDKLLPLRYLPMSIELEIVSNSGDAVQVSTAYGINWPISNVQ
eukprot:15894586-Heterocapsa_arctica.AAC.1